VTSVLQKAGGTGSLADVRNIEIQRITHSGEVQTIPVDLWALLQSGDIDQDIILQDGDTITVPKAKVINPQESQVLASANFSPDKIRINVVGEVLRPGLVELPPNTPLNQAIFASGGFNSIRADQDSVKLVRLNQNGTVTSRIIHLDLSAGINDQNNPILQTNDVVIVNRNGLTQASDTVGLIFSPFSPLVNAASTFGAFNGIKW
jgi:polysaccharide export outer membrane protein